MSNKNKLLKMINFSRKLFFIFIVIINCRCKNNSKKDNSEKLISKFKIEISDTLKILYKGRNVQIIAKNNNNGNLLIGNVNDIDSLIQTDSTGKIINKLFISDKKHTNSEYCFNVGYVGDTSICINTNKGFKIYGLNGDIEKIINEKTELKSLGSNVTKPQICSITYRFQKLLIMQLKNSLSDSDLSNIFSEESYKKYKPITFYNLESKKYTNEIGYEQNSLFYKKHGFLKSMYHYGEPNNIFTLNYADSCIYTIHDPDPSVIKYTLDGKIQSVYKLKPQYFQLPISFNFPGKNRGNGFKYMVVNSSFTDLNVKGDTVIATYRTGIPENIYDATHTDYELPKIWRKYVNTYSIVLVKGKKIDNDILLPKGVVGVDVIYGSNNMIFAVNSLVLGNNYTTFFLKGHLTNK